MYASVADRFYREIEARRCSGLADEVSENVDKHLTYFAWVFGPGAAGKGHSFTLTAEANRHRQFLTQYWQGRAPKLPGWTFYHSFEKTGLKVIAGFVVLAPDVDAF